MVEPVNLSFKGVYSTATECKNVWGFCGMICILPEHTVQKQQRPRSVFSLALTALKSNVTSLINSFFLHINVNFQSKIRLSFYHIFLKIFDR